MMEAAPPLAPLQDTPPQDAGRAAGGIVLVPGRRHRLGDQLYGQLLEQIVAGTLRQGERLPSEKDICDMFGVSRPVVREALQRLRADGLVQARQGSGTYVMARPAAQLTEMASGGDIAEFLRTLEVRMPLEGTASRLAAERRSPEQLARIVAAHEAFTAEVAAGCMSPQTDFAFHAAIAAATGNDMFATLLENIHEALVGFMRVSLELTRLGSRQRAEQVLHEHTQIIEAIRTRDGETAEVAMRFHIGQARRRVVDRSRDK